MNGYEGLSELLGLAGMGVSGYELKGSQEVILTIKSELPCGVCPLCKGLCEGRHSLNEALLIRDLGLWQRRCWLRYQPQRFYCVRCQKLFNERVSWRNVGYLYTLRYEEALYARVRRENIAQVAQAEGLSEGAVRSIFERWAKKR